MIKRIVKKFSLFFAVVFLAFMAFPSKGLYAQKPGLPLLPDADKPHLTQEDAMGIFSPGFWSDLSGAVMGVLEKCFDMD